MWKVWLVSLTVLSVHLFAADVPDWTLRKKKEDADYKYYVGRTSQSPNETQAFREAEIDAIQAAIQENYGVKARISSETYESSQDTVSTKRIEESSKDVELHEFEQVDSFKQEGSEGRFNIWVLYRYRKSAIAAEKRRLATVKDGKASPTTKFSEVGTAEQAGRGIVEITTVPSGATVLVDNEPLGKTPMRLVGQLSSGPHLLRLDHPLRESVEEKVIVVPGKTVSISKRMLGATGRLTVETTPPNASVVISGKPAGTSPVEKFQVSAGEKIVLEITHAEADKYIQELTIAKGETKRIKLDLPLRNSYLSVNSEPNHAKVTLRDDEGKKVDVGVTPTGFVKVKAGDYKLVVTLSGYSASKQEVRLHGGERLAVPTVQLAEKTEDESEIALDKLNVKKKEVCSDAKRQKECHSVGLGYFRNYESEAGERVLKKLCRKGYLPSCQYLAERYSNEEEPDSHLYYLTMSCELGHKLSCANMKAYQRKYSIESDKGQAGSVNTYGSDGLLPGLRDILGK